MVELYQPNHTPPKRPKHQTIKIFDHQITKDEITKSQKLKFTTQLTSQNYRNLSKI